MRIDEENFLIGTKKVQPYLDEEQKCRIGHQEIDKYIEENHDSQKALIQFMIDKTKRSFKQVLKDILELHIKDKYKVKALIRNNIKNIDQQAEEYKQPFINISWFSKPVAAMLEYQKKLKKAQKEQKPKPKKKPKPLPGFEVYF